MLQCRLFVREAMKSSEAPDKVYAVDPDHRTVADKLGECPEGDAVLGIVEGGNQNGRIADVEVGVACGQPLTVEIERRGHGQADYLDSGVILQPQALQPLPVFLEGAVVGIARVVLLAQDDGPWSNKTADVVDMPVRIVTGDPSPQPEDLLDSEEIAEDRLNLFAPEARVSDLGVRVEQALFGGQDYPSAVSVEAAALEDEVAPPHSGTKEVAA